MLVVVGGRSAVNGGLNVLEGGSYRVHIQNKVCMRTCVYVCECMSVCVCLCVNVCVYMSVCVSLCAYVCVSMYTCVYVCDCVDYQEFVIYIYQFYIYIMVV